MTNDSCADSIHTVNDNYHYSIARPWRAPYYSIFIIQYSIVNEVNAK